MSKRLTYIPGALEKVKNNICMKERVNPKNVKFKIIYL